MNTALIEFLQAPYGALPSTDQHDLQSLEFDGVLDARRELLFTGQGAWRLLGDGRLQLTQGARFSTDTLRNSFYIGPWQALTGLKKLSLRIAGSGRCKLVMYQASSGRGSHVLFTRQLNLSPGKAVSMTLPDVDRLWSDGRLFWELEAIEDVELAEAAYATSDRPLRPGTLAVVSRTFGRTDDLIRLLSDFAARAVSRLHAGCLAASKFCVLDATPGAGSRYDQLQSTGLEVIAFGGENLGGGGNASQVLHVLLNAMEAAGQEPDDIVFTDDDLDLSIESLSRYRAFCQYRSTDVISTSPVLMKSDPMVVWEDGGVWGRFHGDRMSADRILVFPRLLKHGWRMTNRAHVNDFGALTFPEYSTFIFFAGSVSRFRTLGYPAAMFLRGDDVEYSLRAKSLNIQMVSNPNLAVWHEPAHSYAQEYMAVLHGLIINMKYGLQGRDPVLNFFKQRFQVHASYLDHAGLEVYTQILEDLVEPGLLLANGFQKHYFDRLKQLKRLEADYERIERSLVNELIERTPARDAIIVPFLYMRPNHDVNTRTIVYENIPHKTFAFKNMDDAGTTDRFFGVAQRFGQAYKAVSDSYEEIAREFVRRLEASSREAFWSELLGDNPTLFTQRRSEVDGGSGASAASDEGVSFNFTAPGQIDDLVKVPSDFDRAGYLRINPDVAAAGMDPVDHYLRHGYREGRVWR